MTTSHSTSTIGFIAKLFGFVGKCGQCGGLFKTIGLTKGHIAHYALYKTLHRTRAARLVYKRVANRCPSCNATICIDCLSINRRCCPLCGGSMDWAHAFEQADGSKDVGGTNAPDKASSPSQRPPEANGVRLGRAAGTEQMAAVSTDEGSILRQGILARHALTKCCELSPEPLKPGAPDLGLQRVVLYRWDGNPIPVDQLDSLILKFLTVRAAKDARFVPVRDAFDAKSVPCPRVGFSIKLERDEVTAACELLATTEYASPGAEFKTTGHGFGNNDVSYRIYFYWNP